MEVILLALWHGLGITLGYHRLLAHRSYVCAKPLEYFLVLGAYLCFQGSPIWWTTIHRTHHKYVDTPIDPHTPLRGLVKAFVGWIYEPYFCDPKEIAPDLYRDPVYRMLGSETHHLRCLLVCILFRVALYLVSPKLAVHSITALAIVWLTPLLLNVICHIRALGYRTYDTKDNSVNCWPLGVFGVGEGFHNNHHAQPGSARIGLQWFEFDLGWWALKLFAAFGWVRLR